MPRFSASAFLLDVRFYGVTFFSYVAKAIAYMLATPEQPDDADNTLTHAFGTEASPEDQAEFLRHFGCRLIEGYGSSESAGMIRLAPEGPASALGRPAGPGVTVADRDPPGPPPRRPQRASQDRRRFLSFGRCRQPRTSGRPRCGVHRSWELAGGYRLIRGKRIRAHMVAGSGVPDRPHRDGRCRSLRTGRAPAGDSRQG